MLKRKKHGFRERERKIEIEREKRQSICVVVCVLFQTLKI